MRGKEDDAVFLMQPVVRLEIIVKIYEVLSLFTADGDKEAWMERVKGGFSDARLAR